MSTQNSENYGHLSRQLKEVRDRLWASELPSIRFETGYLDFLIAEFNRNERIVSALESIGVNLDESDIEALESISRDFIDGWSDQPRNQLRAKINDAIGAQQCELRERERAQLSKSLAESGFVLNDDDGETWTRGTERVFIELTNGREARYRWTYESQDNGTHPLYKSDSGVSGEFHRLMALIAPKDSGVACGGAPPSPLATRVVK